LAQGCDTLVSIGGIQSNQTRQVAAVAAHLGMKCVLVQENWVNYSDAVYDRVGNIEMSRIMGADVRLDAAGFDIGIRPSWEQAMEDVKKAGGKPFPIPAGCSEHPLGGLGFVGFAEEVRQQEAELGFKFDYIVVCSVTGSTQAGMVVGFAADGRADRVIGIDASAKPEHRPEHRSCALPRTPPSWSSWAARSPMPRTWCSTRATAAPSTACPMRARWRRSACARAKKACSPTRCTRASPCTA
jgi:1-aminocyclopropane-1-carboxylate deaminase